MTVYIIGNPAVREDETPVRLIPALVAAFPDIPFQVADPTENFLPDKKDIIVDTVIGIDAPRWFYDEEDFVLTRSSSVHDYDLGLHLRLLVKLGRLQGLTILGIPPGASSVSVIRELSRKLSGADNT